MKTIKKLKGLLKAVVFAMVMVFVLQGCNQDRMIDDSKKEVNIDVKKITFQEFENNQRLTKQIHQLYKKFDVNTNKNIDSNDGSFTILTDDIVFVNSNNNLSYTFLIKTPTDSLSTFENFNILIRQDSLVEYSISKFRLNTESTDSFPNNYEVETQSISQQQIDLNVFDNQNKNTQVTCWEYRCFTSPRDFDDDCTWVLETCDNGGESYTGQTDTGDTNTDDNDTDGNTEDYENTNDPDETATEQYNNNHSAGTNTSTSGGPNVAFGIIPPKSYDDLISDCLNTPRTDNQQTTSNFDFNNWLDDAEIYEKKLINQFLEENDCSNEAQDFVQEAMEAMEGNDYLSFEEYKYIIENEQDYKNRMSISELIIFNALSRLKQLAYLQSAYNAESMMDSLYSPNSNNPCSAYNGQGDAFRHAYWNALSTVRIGESLTNQLTTAHEDRPAPNNYPLNLYNKEKQMDLYNNARGRELAYTSGLVIDAVINAKESGNLRYLSNLNSTNCRATINSSLTPTN